MQLVYDFPVTNGRGTLAALQLPAWPMKKWLSWYLPRSCFQAAKNEAALDHYQVRKHVAWYRHVTLALAAQAWLAAAARPPGALARQRARRGRPG
jgi:hypothetical protein